MDEKAKNNKIITCIQLEKKSSYECLNAWGHKIYDRENIMIIISHIRNASIREVVKVRDNVNTPNRTYTKYDIILKIRANIIVKIGNRKGPMVKIVGDKHIRSDGNKFKADYLGDLPEF